MPATRSFVLRFLTVLSLLPVVVAARAGDLVVAQVAPFSGGVAVYSNEISVGAAAYFEAVNLQGGVNGAKVRLISRDDRGDAERTVSLYEEVARTERPVAFLFPVGPVGIAALLRRGVPQKIGVPIVGTMPSLYKLRQPVSPFVFHIGLGDDAELVKIVQHVATLGIRRIGIVHWDEPSAFDAVSIIEREALARQVEVVMKKAVEAGTDKVAGAIASTNRARPGAVIAILPVHATGALVRSLREAGNGTPVYGPSYTESFLLAQVAGEGPARGVGVSQVVPNPYVATTPLVREYQEHMRRHAPAGTRPSTLSMQGYIAAKIIVEGLGRAGRSPTATTLRDALENLNRYDLGGLLVRYAPGQHVGLNFLDIGVVSANGRLRY